MRSQRIRLLDADVLIDSLIAATALRLNAPLCTFNVKHFRHIPRLIIEQPYQR